MDPLELHDLPELIQGEILECAATTGIQIEKIMRWINTARAIRDAEEVAGE